jgi:Domain of unknown function (DUF4886)
LKKYLYLIFCIISILSCNTKTVSKSNKNEVNKIEILFIGNSYTYNNDLPNQIKIMATDYNEFTSIEVKAFTTGGARLQDHLKSSFTLETIRNGNWDIVIFQGHSLETLKDPLNFRESALALIKIANETGAKIFLFETWSRADGESAYNEEWSGRTPDAMQDQISRVYNEVAKDSPAIVIPIGKTWQKFMKEYPNIELHSTDGSHPTPHGSYLAACVIYTYLFNDNPENISYLPLGIEKADAKKIRFMAGNALIH